MCSGTAFLVTWKFAVAFVCVFVEPVLLLILMIIMLFMMFVPYIWSDFLFHCVIVH